MLIKRIDWLTLRSFLPPFIMSFAIILFILVLQFMSLYMLEIVGKGLGPEVLMKLIYYAAGRMALVAMPVAILAAGLMTFGSMGEHYELAAIKSCGISTFKAMRSVISFSIALTLFSLWFSFDMIPRANLKFFSLLYDVQRKKADVAIMPGHFYSDIDGYVIRISDKDKKSGTLYDVLIYNHTENRGNNDVIRADSALTAMDGNKLKMVLYHGARYEEYKPESGQTDKYPHGRTYFDSLYYQFQLEGFDLARTDESQFRHQITLSKDELGGAIDSLALVRSKYTSKSIKQISRYNQLDSAYLYNEWQSPDTTKKTITPYATVEIGEGQNLLTCTPSELHAEYINRSLVNARAVKSYVEFMIKKRDDQLRVMRNYIFEYYNRFALPVNCILFMIIGGSLGAIIRKGGLGPPALISIILFLVFYILTTYGKKFAKEGVLDPLIGAWLPVLVFTPLALALLYQVTTDSSILDESSWTMLRDRISFLINKLKWWKKND